MQPWQMIGGSSGQVSRSRTTYLYFGNQAMGCAVANLGGPRHARLEQPEAFHRATFPLQPDIVQMLDYRGIGTAWRLEADEIRLYCKMAHLLKPARVYANFDAPADLTGFRIHSWRQGNMEELKIMGPVTWECLTRPTPPPRSMPIALQTKPRCWPAPRRRASSASTAR